MYEVLKWNSPVIIDKTREYLYVMEYVSKWNGILYLLLCNTLVVCQKRESNPADINLTITYWEVAIIVTHMEVALNLRPLHSIFSDLEDLSNFHSGSLSGQYFLYEPDLLDVLRNLSVQMAILECCIDDFWNQCWLNYLNAFTKVLDGKDTLIVAGTLFLLRNPNMSHLQWPAVKIISF